MKNVILVLFCLLFANVQALEYESQFENDQICIAKVKIQAHEEIGLHRDVYPQIVIALKGGTITRLESDGRITDVEFPTGVTVFRKADPEHELHKSINNSSEPVELLIIQLKKDPTLGYNSLENSYDISVNIKINCPSSHEFEQFLKSVPSTSNYCSSFEDWKSSFINNMKQLIQLVDSEKIFNSAWSVSTAYNPPQEDKKN